MSIKIYTCLFAVGLAACANKSDPHRVNSDSATPKEIVGTATGEPVNHYVQNAELNLIETDQELSQSKSNLVSIQGSGEKSAYTITYHFNSRGNTSFKAVETSLASKYSNCSPPRVKMTLRGRNTFREVSVLDRIDLEQNSEYFLDVDAVINSCKTIEMNFNLIAWAGSQTTDPEIATICESNKVGQTTFLSNENLLTAYTSITTKEKFLDMGTFCGEPFPGSKKQCTWKGFMGLSTQGPAFSAVECNAASDKEKRSFSVSFTPDTKNVTVNCKNNDIESFSDTLTECHNTLIDFTTFKLTF